MAEAIGLLQSLFHRYHNIAHGHPFGVGIKISGLNIRFALRIRHQRKGKHIGRGLYIAVFLVEPFYLPVIDKRYARLTGELETVMLCAAFCSFPNKTACLP